MGGKRQGAADFCQRRGAGVSLSYSAWFSV
jgi:hypothetical protein